MGNVYVRPVALTPALSHGERENTLPAGPVSAAPPGKISAACCPHSGTEYSLSLEGEGWGEGEHTAVAVISFALRALAL